MSDVFFNELDIRAPDMFLGVGSGTHAVQTASVMLAIEPVLDACQPDMLLVVGDVNSTLAAALVASKKGIPIAHVEAGLRSNDRDMPEEVNRVLTDQIADLLFTTERTALDNLVREGIAAERVRFVGNVMIDTLLQSAERAIATSVTIAASGVDPAVVCEKGFALATLHRPSNVDDPHTLGSLLHTLRNIADRIPLVFPVHPRTRNAVAANGFTELLEHEQIVTLPPTSYLATIGLMRDARFVLTDSGGIQEETTGLGVPCITVRENTERPITVAEGTNSVVGVDPKAIMTAVEDLFGNGGKRGRRPEFWDGRSAERIAAEINCFLDERKARRQRVAA